MQFPLPILLPPDRFYTEGGLQSISTLDSSTTKIATLLHAADSANATHIYFRTNTVTTFQPIVVGLQDATSVSSLGRPSGTWLGTTNNGKATVNALSTLTTYRVALNEQVPLTRNTPYFIVIEWESTAGNLRINTGVNALHGYQGYQSTLAGRHIFNGTSWTGQQLSGYNLGTAIGIETDAANWAHRDVFLTPSNVISPGNGFRPSSPTAVDEHGNRMYLPACKLSSLWVPSDLDGSHELRLYDDSDNILRSVSIDPALRLLNAYGGNEMPIQEITLTEGWYRVALKALDPNVNVSYYKNEYLPEQLNGRSMAGNCYACSRIQGGAWTDDVNCMCLMGVGVKEFINSNGSTPMHPLIRSTHPLGSY